MNSVRHTICKVLSSRNEMSVECRRRNKLPSDCGRLGRDSNLPPRDPCAGALPRSHQGSYAMVQGTRPRLARLLCPQKRSLDVRPTTSQKCRVVPGGDGCGRGLFRCKLLSSLTGHGNFGSREMGRNGDALAHFSPGLLAPTAGTATSDGATLQPLRHRPSGPLSTHGQN